MSTHNIISYNKIQTAQRIKNDLLNRTAFKQTSNMPHRNLSGIGGDTYNGYFKVIQTDTNKIKIVDGANEESSLAGIFKHGISRILLSATELTVTDINKNGVFLKVYVSESSSNLIGEFVLENLFINNQNGEIYILLAQLFFEASKLNKVIQKFYGGDASAPSGLI